MTSTARSRPGPILAVLSVAAFAYILLQSMVIPALPTIAEGLGTTQGSVTWVLTAYLLSASVATPVIGRLGDVHGKRRMLTVVLVLLVVGSVVAALATTLAVMVVARVIQGAGGAIFPLAFSIIRDEFPRERIAGAIGMMSALIGIGAGVAIVVAGPVADNLSYHWLFWIPGAMSLVAAIAAFVVVPESPVRAPGRVSLLSAATLSGWLVCLLLAVSEGRTWGWTSDRIIGLFVAAVVLFVAWLRIELRSSDPLVDIRMMRIPTVWWTNVSATLLGFGMYSLMVAVPAFLQTPTSSGYGFGETTTGSGFVLLPMSFAMLVAGILTGTLTGRFGSKVPLVLGSAIGAVGMLFLAVEHGTVVDFYIAQAVIGLGIGLAFSAMSNLVVEAVPPQQTGVATGMNANVRTIGGSIGSQVVAALIVGSAAASGLPTVDGYVRSFLVLAGAFAIAAGTALLVPSAAARRAAALADATEAHEFDELSTDPSAVATAEAGLAIGEAIEHRVHPHPEHRPA